ncbi:hypothetical protein OM076_11065 [Solirubrobacter ginsenosidimutans]|uniref:G domain-containing protein n=2 Tax=Solirubrobacter ginsenosidimutans TaxID=490573 RepID=A0A9X3MT88_9ACTN|nr:hypothetical protein [Solirubrobacter ginsenosidimutans]
MYKNQDQIKDFWGKFLKLFGSKKAILAVTGMPAVGKTVLLEHVSGQAYRAGYVPPGKSDRPEKAKVKGARTLVVTAFPGQQTPVRADAMNKVFEGKTPVAGVLHVVSNGYTKTRGEWSPAVLQQAGADTLDKFRSWQMAEEVKDLQRTGVEIRRSWQKHRRPMWMIVAVNKVDLFAEPEQLAAARDSYTAASSPFREELDQLTEHIGSDNFHWTTLPACNWLESFTWGSQQIPSTLNVGQRDVLVYQLSRSLQAHASAYD